jgi:hypothetical protein
MLTIHSDADRLLQMDTKIYFCILAILLVSSSVIAPLSAATEADPCAKEGIIIKNLTLRNDLWYRKNKGDCTLLRRHHTTAITPEDTLEIFSDLVCKSLYCPCPSTYTYYRSLDKDGDCKIRILPESNLTDM